MLSRLKAHVKTKRFWLIFLGVFLATSLVINVVALFGIRSLVEPPAKGQYHDLLQKPPLANPLNSTGTLFENTVDKLSGGMVSVLIFPKESNFCDDSKEGGALEVAACVDRFKPTFIAVTEGVVRNWESNYTAAQDAGLPEEAEKINQWEKHLAAHEFAHVLQYNYREKTVPFEDKYFGGDDNYLPLSYEAMAECYAQVLYPMDDSKASKPKDFTTVNFYNFPAEERFGLCTEDQQNGIKDWLKAINYPLEGRWDGSGGE